MIAISRNTYLGLFFTTLSLLMYEILLTRIFSVIAYYHFAFMAISIAMFGMTLGSMLVYLMPSFQNVDKTNQSIAVNALLFSVSIVLSFLFLISIPIKFSLTINGILLSMLVYLLISIPFIFSGISICLILTRFTHKINQLYAVDLFGASIGCIAVVVLLNYLSAPSCIFFVAAIAGASAVFFSIKAGVVDLKRTSLVFTLLFIFSTLTNIILEENNLPIFRFKWAKNHYENIPLYEKWNSFSRITINGNQDQLHKPFGWGISSVYPRKDISRYLWLTIDSSAGTPLTEYINKTSDIEYLKYDITNVVHYFRPAASILVIGVGGGRDILSALAFNQKSIVGVEINKNILNLLNHQFKDYTGQISKDNRVTLINDEARSYVTRSIGRFDIIQMSLIDTWAATSAGAFALSENSLYTVENWQLLLNHLTPHGILTVSRWYLLSQPAEMYRLTILATQALKNMGVKNPEKHIMIFSTPSTSVHERSLNVATLMISIGEFSAKDIEIGHDIARKFNFELLLSPGNVNNSIFYKIASDKNLQDIIDHSELNLSPPTDDKPFFFQMIKLKSICNVKLWNQTNYFNYNSHAVVVIGVLLITVTMLTLVCIFLPLVLLYRGSNFIKAPLLLTYFAAIGLGFMLIEISQMQRLSIFLGHPTYGLSVVLFTLLMSCGVGSILSNIYFNEKIPSLIPFLMLIFIIILFGFLSGPILYSFVSASNLMRILIAVLLLLPMGLSMGMALPIGLQMANQSFANLKPWLWGINGATSICGSVLAIAIAFMLGISFSFWVGVMCYLIAFAMFTIWYLRR